MTELHPEAERLVDRLAEKSVPPSWSLSPEGSRRALRTLFVRPEAERPEVSRVRTVVVESRHGDLPLRLYEPPAGDSGADGPAGDDPGADAADRLPVLVYYHGGGWVRGDLDTHDELCRHFTRELGCLTVAVDYHRAPEHPFPAAADDAYRALEWVGEAAPAVGADPDRVALAGDSAGGNLAAATALRARDEDGPAVAHQVLLYPITDCAFDTDSYAEHAENPMLSRRSMRWYWDHYLAREVDGANPYAAPLRARSLADLPPTTALTAGHDPLCDEGEAYADRLREAGVDVVYREFEGMVHAFVSFPELERAQAARAQVVDRLEAAFEG